MENNLISVSFVGEYLICPRRLWLRIKNNIPTIPTLEMKKGRWLHKLKDDINKAAKQATSREDCPTLITQFTDQALSYCEVFDFDPEFLSEFVRKEVWKDFLMMEKGIDVVTEYPIKSFDLGVTGKIDRVEFYQDESITVVETKTSNSNNCANNLYYRHQITLYKALLEKYCLGEVTHTMIEQVNGRCKKIVPIVLGDGDVQQALNVIKEIKTLLNSEEIPQAEPNRKCLSCPQNITNLCPVMKKLVGENG